MILFLAMMVVCTDNAVVDTPAIHEALAENNHVTISGICRANDDITLISDTKLDSDGSGEIWFEQGELKIQGPLNVRLTDIQINTYGSRAIDVVGANGTRFRDVHVNCFTPGAVATRVGQADTFMVSGYLSESCHTGFRLGYPGSTANVQIVNAIFDRAEIGIHIEPLDSIVLSVQILNVWASSGTSSGIAPIFINDQNPNSHIYHVTINGGNFSNYTNPMWLFVDSNEITIDNIRDDR